MKVRRIVPSINSTWFNTLRRCPECEVKAEKLISDGKGNFYCNRCGYTEGKIDLSKHGERELTTALPGWHV